MIAQVAVSDSVYAIDRPYSYRVPDGLMLRSGMRVLVPFGNGNRKKEAVVLAVSAGEEAKLNHPVRGALIPLAQLEQSSRPSSRRWTRIRC